MAEGVMGWIKQHAGEAGKWADETLKKVGLRGEAAPAAPATPGTGMAEYDATRDPSRAHGPVRDPLVNAKNVTPPSGAAIDPATVRTGFGPQGSPEAQAFRASQAGAGAAPAPAEGYVRGADGTLSKAASGAEAGAEEVAKKGMLRNMAGKVGTGMGWLARNSLATAGLTASGMGAYDAIKDTSEGATYENRPERAGKILAGLNPLPQALTDNITESIYGARGAASVGASPYDKRGSTDFGKPGVGANQPVVAPPSGVADREDAQQGEAMRSAALRGPVTPPTPMVPTSAGPQTPQQVIDGTAVPAIGTGVIQRTGGPQGKGTATAVGLRQPGQPEVPQKPDDLAALRRLGGQGAFGSMAALGGYGAISRMKKEEADLGLRTQAAQMSVLKYNNEVARDKRDFDVKQEESGAKRFDDVLKQHSVEVTGAQKTSMVPGMSEKPEEYKARVAQTEAKVKGDISYTLGDTAGSKKIGDLAPAEQQQLLMGSKMKGLVEKARESGAQWARDFFGNKRFDSKNLYSYMPADAEGTVIPFQGGYLIRTRNGNTLSVSKTGGGFNFTGPNDPVDADVMSLVGPVIEKFERSQQKPKGARS